MGMYTEFIFGCSLSKDTPKIAIDSLDYVVNGENKRPKYENPTDWAETLYNSKYIERTSSYDDIQKFIGEYDLGRLFCCDSYYFGAPQSAKLYYDTIDGTYKISTRASLKNYNGQIEKFIDYIKPYIKSGSGYEHNIFAYVQYEEAEFPTIYGIDGTYEVNPTAIK